jgi:hypothetical protein
VTLRMAQVLADLPAVVERYREQLAAMAVGLDAADAALAAWSRDPATSDRTVHERLADKGIPYALSAGEDPAATFGAPALDPLTVVAADGSSIEPDRFGPVPCYVVNTGYALLPYGTACQPRLGSEPIVGPPGAWHDDGDDPGDEAPAARGFGVNLVRDVRELEMGESVATEALASGPAVLLLDGTLLPWDLDSRLVAGDVREEMRRRTREALDGLRAAGDGLSMGAYISGSRAADVAASLRALGTGGGAWPLADAAVFARRLQDGERSALFSSASGRPATVESDFPEHAVRFFYVRVGEDIARVELPQWAATGARLGRLHAAILDQCRRCGGYPRALQEAHEQAVITAGDRVLFSRLLDREAGRHGLRAPANGKQSSKRRRAV